MTSDRRAREQAGEPASSTTRLATSIARCRPLLTPKAAGDSKRKSAKVKGSKKKQIVQPGGKE